MPLDRCSRRVNETTARMRLLTAYREEGWLKDDLVSALDGYLRANATTLSSSSAFSEYYDRTGSPTKREPRAPDTEPRPRRRRQTKVKEEIDSL